MAIVALGYPASALWKGPSDDEPETMEGVRYGVVADDSYSYFIDRYVAVGILLLSR